MCASLANCEYVSLARKRVVSQHILPDRFEHEFSLMHQQMGYSQALRVDDLVAEDCNIQIDVPRAFVD